jgi:hypothetical protein
VITLGEQLCHVDACTRPGCSPAAGCQGHAVRERAPANITERAQQLVREAAGFGLVLTIEQRPLQPLAMGHHEDVVSVRGAR